MGSTGGWGEEVTVETIVSCRVGYTTQAPGSKKKKRRKKKKGKRGSNQMCGSCPPNNKPMVSNSSHCWISRELDCWVLVTKMARGWDTHREG